MVAPFLWREAQVAYYALSLTDTVDYDKMKAEVLVCIGLTSAAEEFCKWSYKLGITPRKLLDSLLCIARRYY